MLHSLNDSAIRSDNVIYDLVGKGGSKSLFSLGKVTYTLCDIDLFNPYRDDNLLNLVEAHYKDDLVYLTISLPEGLLKSFTGLLVSLRDFFKFLALQGSYARVNEKPFDLTEEARRKKAQDDFDRQVLSLFDNYLSQGLAPREAIKRTRKALEDMEHPWASYDAVFRVVSGSGALRGKGFYKGWYARYRKNK